MIADAPRSGIREQALGAGGRTSSSVHAPRRLLKNAVRGVETHDTMLVVTPTGRLGYVTAQVGDIARVLLFEEYFVREFTASELRPLVAPAA